MRCFQYNILTPVTENDGGCIFDFHYCIYPHSINYSFIPDKTHSPLQHCEDYCEDDADCDFGMRCFQRNTLIPVPVCNGEYVLDYDYWFYPFQIDYGFTPDITYSQIQQCEGDCDADGDSVIRCFQHINLTPVPKCNGENLCKYNYCGYLFNQHFLPSTININLR